ncbi:MAG: carbon storage regulator [Anaerolineales bacterium]|nr:carbon storage regulator [Anaerolineales bacterium]
MLVLTRRPEDGLVLTVPGTGEQIEITVLGVDGDKVRLGIAAPKSVTILRRELCDAVQAQNRAAARPPADALAPELLKQLWGRANPAGAPPADEHGH